MDKKELALKKHAEWKGKLSVVSKAPITNKEELAVAYTPGVAEPVSYTHLDVYKRQD